jgi:hypothetical protein
MARLLCAQLVVFRLDFTAVAMLALFERKKSPGS